jgi:hypothetical protein
MKKVKVTGKLSLGKETIVKLNNEQMNGVMGASTVTTLCWPTSCAATCGTVNCQ